MIAPSRRLEDSTSGEAVKIATGNTESVAESSAAFANNPLSRFWNEVFAYTEKHIFPPTSLRKEHGEHGTSSF